MSNEIRNFLAPEDVVVGLEADCKRSVLKRLSEHAARRLDLDPGSLLDSLLEREQLGTTGIGSGVAVPHTRAEVGSLRAVLARLNRPVDFDAIDDRPVDLIFLLLAPEQATAEHLKALSRIARLVRSNRIQSAMRGANDAHALYAVAIGESDAEAA